MERVVLAIVCAMVHMPSTALRYLPFRDHISKKKKILLTVLYSISLAAIGALYYLFGKDHTVYLHKLMMFSSIISVTAINILVIRGKWKEHLFTAGLTSTFVTVTFFSVAFLVQHIYPSMSELRLIIVSSFFSFIVLMIAFKPFLRVLKRTVTPFLSLNTGDYWNSVWYVPLAMFFVGYLSAPLDTYSGSFFLFFSRLVLLVATLMICNSISKDHVSIKHRLSLEEQLMLQDRYYHAQTERVMEARKHRHDMKHHMAAVLHYIETDDKSGLTEYMEDVKNHISGEFEIPRTGNPALDGVVYRYAYLSHENGISFEMLGTVGKLTLNNTDLCVLLGNALDNAVTAAAGTEGEKYVKLIMKKEGNYAFVSVINSYDGQVKKKDEEFLSKKRNSERTGVGISSMRDICKQHSITMDIRHDNEKFAVMFIIELKNEE